MSIIREKAERIYDKMKRKTKRRLILLGLAAAVVIFAVLIVYGVRSIIHQDVDTSEGIAYIRQEEAGDVSAIENKISLLEQQESSEDDDDTRSVKEMFSGAVVIGDSVTQGFSEFDILNTSSVVAEIGVHLYEADELVVRAGDLSPKTIFLALGRNDLAATEGDADEFISQYTDLLDQIKKELPDANVFVDSIFPVQESALEDDPYYEYIEDYNTALKELCDSRSIGFIDCTELAEDQYYEEDGQHFKADFYPVWAEYMAEVAGL